ncbi:MAG TPA: NAD-binding protein [Patescibacteria group bacterium]|nr:NAD-binding protein [Patescibacteria group bacterium]
MNIIIVGGNEIGLNLAKLFEKEAEITIVEKDEILAKELSQKTNVLIIHGDGTDISILKEAKINKADALVVTTGDDTINLMVSQIGKSEKVPIVIPLVRKPENVELFKRLGVNSVVSVAGSIASDINRVIRTHGDAKIIAQFGKGDVQIIQQLISKDSKLINNEAEIKNAVITAIYRDDKIIIPEADTRLKQEDVLLLAIETKYLKEVLELIEKK